MDIIQSLHGGGPLFLHFGHLNLFLVIIPPSLVSLVTTLGLSLSLNLCFQFSGRLRGRLLLLLQTFARRSGRLAFASLNRLRFFLALGDIRERRRIKLGLHVIEGFYRFGGEARAESTHLIEKILGARGLLLLGDGDDARASLRHLSSDVLHGSVVASL